MKLMGLLAAALFTAPLNAQGTDVTVQLAGRAPASVIRVVQALADSAVRAGVPDAPLVQKALEGSAKNVPPERVIVALHALFRREVTALAALRRGGLAAPASADIDGAVFALSAGLADSDVSSITHAGDGTYAAASTLRVAGTLAALGVPAGGTVQLVSLALAQGISPGELATFPGSVEAAMAHGGTPGQAAAGLARALGHENGNNGNGKSKGRGRGPKS